MRQIVKVTMHGCIRPVRMLMGDVTYSLWEGPYPIIEHGVVTRGFTIESISEEERREIELAMEHGSGYLVYRMMS